MLLQSELEEHLTPTCSSSGTSECRWDGAPQSVGFRVPKGQLRSLRPNWHRSNKTNDVWLDSLRTHRVSQSHLCQMRASQINRGPRRLTQTVCQMRALQTTIQAFCDQQSLTAASRHNGPTGRTKAMQLNAALRPRSRQQTVRFISRQAHRLKLAHQNSAVYVGAIYT